MKTLILGSPGSGKTTRLIAIMKAALARGVAPERVAFVSFTKAAVDEAKAKAIKAFGLGLNDLPNFRTVHSLAFRELGLSRNAVVTEKHLEEFASLIGEEMGGDMDEGPAMGRNASPLLTIDHYARATRQGLKDAWADHGGNVDWFRLKRFSDSYSAYRQDMGLLDFTDMLTEYLSVNISPLDLDTAIVDEAQDLTLLQWAVLYKAFAAAENLYVAGDENQAIYEWSGAAIDHFLGLDYPREVLPISHRLPKEIFDLSQTIAKRISRRFPKAQVSGGRKGVVEWLANPEEANLSGGTWLLLARTRAQLKGMVGLAREQGVIYSMKGVASVDEAHVNAIRSYEALRAGKRIEANDAQAALSSMGVKRPMAEDSSYTASELGIDATPIWHDALIRIPLDTREYYLACMRRGEKLTSPPRVRIETIHGAKGAEAQNVLLKTDLTYKTHRGASMNPDSEHRVFFVGTTRASEKLFLCAPQSAYEYRV